MQSNISSQVWRQKGNEFFQQRNYNKALDCYNQSILVSAYSTESTSVANELSLAYANRSAALYHMDNFKLSLQDIDLAIEHGYPEDLVYKIQQRKGLCLFGLGLTKEAIVAFTTTLELIESHASMDRKKQTSLKAEVETYIDKCAQRNFLKKSIMSETIEKDDFLRSEVITNASSSVGLWYNDIKGRYLVANSFIHAGSVVIQELPFASVLLREHYGSHCYFCYRQLIAIIPCSHCKDVLYCSRDCQQSAWKEYHSIEYPHWKTLQQLGTFAWLSLRIVISACSKVVDGLTFLEEDTHKAQESNVSILPGCEPDGTYMAGYHAVYSLMSHNDHHTKRELSTYKQKAELLARYFSPSLLQKCNLQKSWKKHPDEDVLCQKLSHLSIKPLQGGLSTDDTDHTIRPSSRATHDRNGGKSDDNTCDFTEAFDPVDDDHKSECDSSIMKVLVEKFILHMQQLKCNAHAITAIQNIKHDVADDMMNSGHSGMVRSTGQARIATAVYATSSLMNHSCKPNVIASFQGRQLTIRAIKDIQKHEEIQHCYGPHSRHMDTMQRQKILQEQYFFTCRCIACEEHNAKPSEKSVCDWSRAFQCTQCKEPIAIRKSPANMCYKCQQEINIDVLKKQALRASQLFSQAMVYLHNNDIDKCLPILQQCYEIRTRVLYKHHRDLAETQDCIARCHASNGNFRKAGEYLHASIVSIGKIYGEDSIEFANELQKVAQVYFNGREVKKAFDAIEQALQVLSLHYGSNHESLYELKQMKMCLIQAGMK